MLEPTGLTLLDHSWEMVEHFHFQKASMQWKTRSE
jgi:hypothetical protein